VKLEPAVMSGSARPERPLTPRSFHFGDFETVVDRVHALFDSWERDETLQPPLDIPALHQLKLAVHEWLSNLIQHADFSDRTPEVELEITQNGTTVHCAILDNSLGFDLDAQLSARSEILERFPERGMGLLMIKACTKDLRYTQHGEDRHRLEFRISAEHDPWLNIPF
jgi:serine/threonine-protein kinase RsbW